MYEALPIPCEGRDELFPIDPQLKGNKNVVINEELESRRVIVAVTLKGN